MDETPPGEGGRWRKGPIGESKDEEDNMRSTSCQREQGELPLHPYLARLA